MDSNQNEIDFLAGLTLELSDSIKNRTYTPSKEFDEDLIEFEKFKDSFIFAPIENNGQDEEVVGPTLEELEALCLGVFGFEENHEEIAEEVPASFEPVVPSFFTTYEDVQTFDIDFKMPDEDEEVLNVEVELEFEDNSEQEIVEQVVEAFVEEEPFIDVVLDTTAPLEMPGIAYNVLVGASTFCVKALCLKDLSRFEINDSVNSRLKLEEGDEPHFFVTNTWERAEVLVDQIANRRFTKHEDMICNIGDPGFSWWLEKRSNGLSVYFKSYKVNRVDEAIRLGPIGDVQVALMRLSKLGKVFKNFFPVSEFSCDENALHFATSFDNQEAMNNLITLFERGEFLFNLNQFPDDKEAHTLFLYLQELSDVRAWWLEVDEIANS